MSRLEAVLTDLDGSLLDSQKRVSEEDLETIRKLRDKGVRFHITTGRPAPFAKQCAEDTGFESVVSCCNGAYIYDFLKDEVVFYDRLIAPEDVIGVRDYCLEQGIDYLLYSLEGIVFDRPDSKRTLFWRKQNEEKFNEKNKLTFLYDSPDLDLSHRRFVKILLPYISDENVEKIKEKYGDQYEICFSEKAVLEVNLKGISKGYAVRTLSELYHFDLANTLVLGDNFNDEAMLRVCGYPVVPENGEEDMKKLACYITSDNDHSPLTNAIRGLFPELL